jgi:hypothetical protein
VSDPRQLVNSPALTIAARGLLWELIRAGHDRDHTAARLAEAAARNRPGRAEHPGYFAAALAELAAAGAVTAGPGGRYRLAVDREADMTAAKIAGQHVAHCRPPLTRHEIPQWQQLVRELILAGHDPADVEFALSRCRERRAAGARSIGRSVLEMILADIELDNARIAAEAGDCGAAVACTRSCGGFHPPTAACWPHRRHG